MLIDANHTPDPLLICPVCRLPLRKEPGRLVCSSSHSYDLSAKGYAHLLPGSAQRITGDSLEMVRARRRFLKAGYYASLQQKLASMAVDVLKKTIAASVQPIAASEQPLSASQQPLFLDAGCGEGYYTAGMADAICKTFAHAHCYGTDISKDAVRLAAGACKQAFFFVSSVFSLPISNRTLDLITCVFAPDAHAEFARVLKKGGSLITVTPGKKHLAELKKVLYEQVIDNPTAGQTPQGFDCVRHEQLDLQVTISGYDRDTGIAHLHDLLAMTPYYWKTPAVGVKRLKELDQLDISLSFCLDVYRKS